MSYAIISAQIPEHREAIQTLWKQNLNDPNIASLAEDRFRWLYERSPEGSAQTWLAVDTKDGNIVGCASVFIWNKSLDGKIVKVAVPFDFAVDAMHRLGGAAMALQRNVMAGSESCGAAFLIAYPNQKSLPVFHRLRYQPIGTPFSWVKPLRSAAKLSKMVGNQVLAKGASMIVDPALGAADFWRRNRQSSMAAGETVEAADSRFDELWSASRAQYRIASEASSGYLNWRYAASPKKRHRFYCLPNGQGSLSAFLVFSMKSQEVSIDELFAGHQDAPAVDQLLLQFAAEMRRQRVQSIRLTFFGSASFEKRLETLGFFRREPSGQLLVHTGKGLREEYQASICDKENWFLFAGQMDI